MEGGRADERTFTVSFPWRDFSLNYLLNGLQGQDFNMCGCVCQHLCALECYGMLRGIFLHFTHAFPPRRMCHCRGKKKKKTELKWFRPYVPPRLSFSRPASTHSAHTAHTHTHTYTVLPTSLSFSLASASANVYVQRLTTQPRESRCHERCKKCHFSSL